MEQKSLNNILKEHLTDKGLTIERLSTLTDIPSRYLTGLVDGDVSKLPPAPYVRGYLLKLGGYLGLDGQELWDLFKKEQLVKSSGADDTLPANRFAIKKNKKGIFVGIGFGVLIGLYLLWNIGHLLGRPGLNITYPETQTAITTQSLVTITGQIDPADKLTINNQEIPVSENGYFEKEVELALGLNRIDFLVKRFLGKETSAVRQIVYQP
ncbi:MAG: helix-turn-helix domain-containing protein [bacterium]|nr:helix-turn-helix domain-containing protein [bacterium]